MSNVLEMFSPITVKGYDVGGGIITELHVNEKPLEHEQKLYVKFPNGKILWGIAKAHWAGGMVEYIHVTGDNFHGGTFIINASNAANLWVYVNRTPGFHEEEMGVKSGIAELEVRLASMERDHRIHNTVLYEIEEVLQSTINEER